MLKYTAVWYGNMTFTSGLRKTKRSCLSMFFMAVLWICSLVMGNKNMYEAYNFKQRGNVVELRCKTSKKFPSEVLGTIMDLQSASTSVFNTILFKTIKVLVIYPWIFSLKPSPFPPWKWYLKSEAGLICYSGLRSRLHCIHHDQAVLKLLM